MIKLEEYISLSEGKTVSGRFSIHWTKTFEGIKIPHRKQDCSDCDNRKICNDCVTKPKKNCFNCELERSCKSCLDLISQKKTYSTDINMLKRKPPNEYHQMLPHYIGKYEPKQNNINFESAKEILMKEDDKMVEKRRFERINDMISYKSYIKYEDISENKEIFIYGFKHVKTDKIDNYILIASESDELHENDKLFNIWSNKLINKEIENRNFKLTGWPFITLVKRNNFFKIQSIITWIHIKSRSLIWESDISPNNPTSFPYTTAIVKTLNFKNFSIIDLKKSTLCSYITDCLYCLITSTLFKKIILILFFINITTQTISHSY